MQYREEYRLSLEEYQVEPSSVVVLIWHPFFAWLQGLPVPPEMSPAENLNDYIKRCGQPPCDVDWVHTPLVNGAGEVNHLFRFRNSVSKLAFETELRKSISKLSFQTSIHPTYESLLPVFTHVLSGVALLAHDTAVRSAVCV